jgi:RimJ/RimL family protein N-acetyltransferase
MTRYTAFETLQTESSVVFGHEPISTPVRLDSPDRTRVLAHFSALGADARRLRFGTPLADDAVRRYVEQLHFERDLVLGLADHFRALVGVVHLARISNHAVEFSISLLRGWRGRGYGQEFTARALNEAARQGYQLAHVQFMHCNRPMGAIMDHYAAARERAGTEHLVEVSLPAMLARPFKAQLGPFIPSTLAFAS